ncbi:MAG: trypsin-like peptidase domain-containing protein [Chitinophagales bacterium]|nr:trypsin-like peptidase domain-containing protein [Chitinophagales bacterium]
MRANVSRLLQQILFVLLTSLFTSCNNHSSEKKPRDVKFASPVSTQLTPEEIAKDALSYTVAITVQDKDHQTLGLGSGFIVENGVIVTNLHVIEGAKYAFVNLRKEKYNVDGYLAIDNKNDLALLAVPLLPQRIKPVEIDTTMPNVGSKIFSVGNPHGLDGTFAEGNVSAVRDYNGRELIQITAPISPGSSGGPILNFRGALTGIAVGGIFEGQNLNFSIPSKYLKQLLEGEQRTTSLNIPKAQIQSQKNVEALIKNGVVVRNLVWHKYSDSDPMGFGKYDPIFDKTTNPLVEFSILNQLNKSVSNIQLFFVLYDKKGVPVDYDYTTIDATILPGLGSTFTEPYTYDIHLDKKAGYKCEVRVLDFSILKE